jgi:predicted Zn-dependent protease
MLNFSRGDYPAAADKLRRLLAEDPSFFDAQLALGMALSRSGDHAAAIVEGHRAEKLRPRDPLAHTNLSVFYMKAGNRAAAEHHGSLAKIASWQETLKQGERPADSEQPQLAAPKPAPVKVAARLPDMPWKKKPAA